MYVQHNPNDLTELFYCVEAHHWGNLAGVISQEDHLMGLININGHMFTRQ